MTKKPEGPREPNDSLTIVEYWDKGTDEKYVYLADHVRLMQAYDQLLEKVKALEIEQVQHIDILADIYEKKMDALKAERDALKKDYDKVYAHRELLLESEYNLTVENGQLRVERDVLKTCLFQMQECAKDLTAKCADYEAALWFYLDYFDGKEPYLDKGKRVREVLEKWRPK